MDEELQKDKILRVEDDLTILNAVALREQFKSALSEDGPLLLDLSNVGEMDTAGFQLLAALRNGASSKGRTFRIIAHSQATHSVLKLYNTEEYFGVDTEAIGILGNGADDEDLSSAEKAG